ncbi:hypothetical protein ANN_16995 [Periplaneta americana]|uniref:Uncharacterized protein n=1 Tax=Periplaneta americana TaxID=6978 RepID=A0ABQ8SSH1_PERAM|nr:hypothetical protein ANN_16995 [Periplaneta americana]
MSPGSCTESYPVFAHIGLRENPGKNLNQVTCPDRESNPGHLVSRPDALTVTPQNENRYNKNSDFHNHSMRNAHLVTIENHQSEAQHPYDMSEKDDVMRFAANKKGRKPCSPEMRRAKRMRSSIGSEPLKYKHGLWNVTSKRVPDKAMRKFSEIQNMCSDLTVGRRRANEDSVYLMLKLQQNGKLFNKLPRKRFVVHHESCKFYNQTSKKVFGNISNSVYKVQILFRIHGVCPGGLHLPCHRTTDDRIFSTPPALRNDTVHFNVEITPTISSSSRPVIILITYPSPSRMWYLRGYVHFRFSPSKFSRVPSVEQRNPD